MGSARCTSRGSFAGRSSSSATSCGRRARRRRRAGCGGQDRAEAQIYGAERPRWRPRAWARRELRRRCRSASSRRRTPCPSVSPTAHRKPEPRSLARSARVMRTRSTVESMNVVPGAGRSKPRRDRLERQVDAPAPRRGRSRGRARRADDTTSTRLARSTSIPFVIDVQVSEGPVRAHAAAKRRTCIRTTRARRRRPAYPISTVRAIAAITGSPTPSPGAVDTRRHPAAVVPNRRPPARRPRMARATLDWCRSPFG